MPGCRYGQGYLLSGPVPAAQAAKLVGGGQGLLPRLASRSKEPGWRVAVAGQVGVRLVDLRGAQCSH